MKRLLSFLSLFIIGWGSALANVTEVTYPKTWDFGSFNTELSGEGWYFDSESNMYYIHNAVYALTSDGEVRNGASNGVAGTIVDEFAGLTFGVDNRNRMQIYTNGTGAAFYATTITIPQLMFGDVVTITTGEFQDVDNTNLQYTIDETTTTLDVAPNNDYVVTIPSTITTPTNIGFFVGNSGWDNPTIIKKISVTRSAITNWTNDGTTKININGVETDYSGDFKTGNVVLPWDGTANKWSANTSTISVRLKQFFGSEILDMTDLCDGTEDVASYFEVSFSNPNIISTPDLVVKNADNNTHRRLYLQGIYPLACGSTEMTVTYKGSNGWAPYSKKYNITVKGDYASFPRIIWVSSWNKTLTSAENPDGIVTASAATTNASQQIPGAIYTRKYLLAGKGSSEDDAIITEHADNIFLGYNDKADFHAIPLKAGVTNEDLEEAGLIRVPYIKGNDEHWAILGKTNPDNPEDENYWRTYHLGGLLFASPNGNDATDAYTNLSYEISSNVSDWTVSTNVASGNNNIGGKGAKSFNVYAESMPTDSVSVTAKLTYTGGTIYSTTKFKVNPTKFNMSFQPVEGVVAENRWIMPYVKFPDLKLSDFQRIYVTIENVSDVTGDIVTVDDAAALYNNQYDGTEASVTNIPDWIEWKWSAYKKDNDGNDIPGTRYPIITGIRPKIWGVDGMAGNIANVVLHVESNAYFDSGATYQVTVVGEETNPFHFEINNDDETSDDIKTITIVEGDFIYMPGIVGNPNGNDSYSRSAAQQATADNVSESEAFRPYAYSIKNGQLIMNNDPYFHGEGIADYFFTGSPTANAKPTQTNGLWKPDEGGFFRMIPGSGHSTAVSDVPYPAVIFKEIGLGNYKRNDTLMIYGLHATNDLPCYLWAQDPQSGYACKPIRIKVVPRTIANDNSERQDQSIEYQKRVAMTGMTYPFTWDFEHMNVSDLAAIAQDASNAATGNGGSYWRERWDSGGSGTLRTPRTVRKDYYQYNGGFNADHDDKDNNANTILGTDNDGVNLTGSRQRWFKDITANGKYLDMFKGLMVNIAGLDYWEQKFTRFNVSKNPNGGIYFEGNTHYISMPGFGICGSNNKMADATRNLGELSMPGRVAPNQNDNVIREHVQFKSNDFITSQDDFNSSKSISNNAVTYTSSIDDAQKKNHKVKFVIKAKGNNGCIYIGGKSMMLNTNNRKAGTTQNANDPTEHVGNGTEIGENGTKFDGTYTSGTEKAFIKLKNSTDVYVVELDPWDEDLQEQIYLALRNATIYWMGITTEPRDMQSDYEVFTYSYPKDIDMTRTNEVMGILTKNIVNNEKTGAKGLSFEARYAKEYKRDGQLVAEKIPNYKFGAYEGVFIYPSHKLDDMTKFQTSSMRFNATNYGDPNEEGLNMNYTNAKGEDVSKIADVHDAPVTTSQVIRIALNEDGKAKVDADGNYVYEQKSQSHTYSYLPVYFVANAENMSNYEDNSAHADENDNNTLRGRESRMDESDAAPAVGTDGVDYNSRINLLKGQPYSRWIPQDFYSNTDSITITSGNTGGSGRYRWIPLTMTNKFMARYLTEDREGNRKALGDFLKDENGENVNGESDIYYELIGPDVVRFYRTFVAGTPRGRRGHIVLTWHEYNVDTNGKSGVSNDHEDEYPWTDPEKENDPSPTDGNPPSVSTHAPIRIVFAEMQNNDDENLVSEDAGIPDGIKEVEQSSDASGEFYNLNGTRVVAPTKGIYIVNGKKVIIK